MRQYEGFSLFQSYSTYNTLGIPS
ncbi:hypothetical protein RIR_e3442_jg17170.t1 [Rhizophagus irregularis DAOM 181602=DAOM 197198]|nr:hypothetical protein RIR_e3442_jg17170.t1 [Rhizophagus irregularis DAOM 181602=DAOM 197198]